MASPMSDDTALEALIELSHEFGTIEHVRGGGGNTSVKNATTLWVKPSGTTLSGLSKERLVALDRRALARLYTTATPAEPAAREALVKAIMTSAVRPEWPGRPSVEAPLHDSFEARFVVHTHPPLVNGMTCAQQGAEVCQALFPDALWVPYVDPGYTLCCAVRAAMQELRARQGREVRIVVLQHHGVFVAGDTPEEIRDHFRRIFSTLRAEYLRRGEDPNWLPPPPFGEDAVECWGQPARQMFGGDAASVVASPKFEVAQGPLTPDHIVYARSFPLIGELTRDSVEAYRRRYGGSPRIWVAPDAVVALGRTAKRATLAMELAQDGAQVVRLARAFGGVQYLSDAARLFIENWEVEAYREQISTREG